MELQELVQKVNGSEIKSIKSVVSKLIELISNPKSSAIDTIKVRYGLHIFFNDIHFVKRNEFDS